jgi:predicted enzyme related to lactoylglutathione lyase
MEDGLPAIDTHTPGTFCWTELATHDVDAALAFYGALFGWEPEPGSLGDASGYVRCTLNSRPVAAIYVMSEQERSFHLPPYWSSYVATEDVAALLDKVEELGGTSFEGPIDVPGAGRLGTIEDPDGARLCLWQADGFSGCGWEREINSPVWNEIITRKPEAVRDFYAGLFSWAPATRDLGEEQTYTSFTQEGTGKAGLMEMDERFDGVPAQWLVYVAVASVASTVEAAQALDACILVPPTEIPGVGTFATFKDPEGGTLSVIQMAKLQK